jgi:hypothetical protein
MLTRFVPWRSAIAKDGDLARVVGAVPRVELNEIIQ